MKHTPFALSFFFVSLFFQQARAQQTDPTGYYVTLGNDTLTGSFPHYRETVHSPSSITFLRKGSSREVQLVPDSCLAISIDQSDKYLAYHGQRLVNPTSPFQADGNRPDKYEDVSVFLRELYNDGQFRLYELADQRRQNFFFSGDTFRLQELYYKAFIEDDKTVESPRYKQQLSLLFKSRLDGNIALLHKLERVQYTEADLANFFQTVTGRRNDRLVEKYPAHFIVGLGASANFFHINNVDPTIYIVTGPYKTTFSPLIEFGARVPVARGSDRFFVTFLLHAYAFKHTATQQYLGTDTYKGFVIGLPLSVGYRLINGPTASLALTGGLVADLLLNNSQDITDQTGAKSFHYDNGGTLGFTEFGGLELFLGPKISVAANYFRPYGIGTYVYYKPRHSSAELSVRLAL